MPNVARYNSRVHIVAALCKTCFILFQRLSGGYSASDMDLILSDAPCAKLLHHKVALKSDRALGIASLCNDHHYVRM